jgi:integrase
MPEQVLDQPKAVDEMTAKLRDGVMRRGASWSYVVRVHDPETGRSKPRWVGGFPTESAAKAARDAARVAGRHGSYVDRSAVTVAAYLREWLAGHAVAVKPKTLSGYRDDVEGYVIPHIGRMRLQNVRPATIGKLYRDLLDSGGRNGGSLSPRTVEHVHRTLRKAFGDAVKVEGVLSTNPVVNAKRPRVRSTEPGRLWTTPELRRFLSVAAEHRLGAFYWLAAHTGARRGELLHLRWSDIDLDAGEITVAGSTDVIDGERYEGDTKGGRSRIVSIDAGTVEVMWEHRKRQAAERLAAGPLWRGTKEHVFTAAGGAALYPDTVSALMGTLVRQSGLPPARLHDLRHLHATTLLLAGVPVHVVAARLGHADPAITLRVYAHVLREQAAGVAEVFASAVAAST